MNILAMDTSGSVCSVAVARDNKIIASEYVDNGLTHSALLMPRVDACLHEATLSIADIDLFAVTTGPGSFTGLRIGISTAKGFAQAMDKPIAAFGTLQALAANFLGLGMYVCPVIDARNDRVYTALYKSDGQVAPPSVVEVSALQDFIGTDSVLFCGDGIDAHETKLVAQCKNASFAPLHLRYQRAEALIPLAQKAYVDGNLFTAFDVELAYLVESQAERMLKQRKQNG